MAVCMDDTMRQLVLVMLIIDHLAVVHHSLLDLVKEGPNLPLDIAIHQAHIMPDHKEAFQQAFINDPEMWALTDLIITGWPEDIKEVPHPLCPYWQHRETLTIEGSLVLWGEALIIPAAEGERALHQLHQFNIKE